MDKYKQEIHINIYLNQDRLNNDNVTSITSSQTTPEPTNNQIRNTIIEAGIIKSLHGIDRTYVERVETCCRSWKPNDGNQPPPNIEDYFKK